MGYRTEFSGPGIPPQGDKSDIQSWVPASRIESRRGEGFEIAHGSCGEVFEKGGLTLMVKRVPSFA